MTQLIKLFGEDSSSLVRMKVVKKRMGMTLLCMLRGTQIYQQFKNNVVEVVIYQKIFKVPRRFSCILSSLHLKGSLLADPQCLKNSLRHCTEEGGLARKVRNFELFMAVHEH